MQATAAFIRLEGALARRGSLAAAAYFAANAAGLRERALRIGHLVAAAPFVRLLGQNDRTLTSRVTWAALRGMSEDRITVLAAEYVDGHLAPSLLDSGLELVQRARREGHRVVVVSDSIEPLVAPLLERVRGVDALVCNRLEMRDGEATGRLLDPVVGGHDGGRWVREYATERDLDLSRSVAYGCHGTDLLLLSAVGRPCAVNPDFTLRRAAIEARWAVMDYAA